MHSKPRVSHRSSHRKPARLPIPPRLLRILLVALACAVLLPVSGFTYAASMEQHDSFCASCHTQPESTYYQRSLDATSSDLASAHTPKAVRCIDCHSGEGLPGRMSAELLGAHNAFAWYTRTAVQPAKLTRKVTDGQCLKCHAQVSQSNDQNNHFHYFLSRWQQIDKNAGTCVSCHQGHSTQGDAQLMYLNRDTTTLVCESCHRITGSGD